MSLTNLSYAKNILGITTTAQDGQLQALLDAADAAVKKYCNRDLEQQTYTQDYSGNNTYRLALRQTPVTAVSSVLLDNSAYFGTKPGSFDPVLSLLTEGMDYALDREPGANLSKSGILFRIGTVWPIVNRWQTFSRLSQDLGPAFGNIRISYTAGYSPVPSDLQFAVVMIARYMQTILPFGGQALEHEKLGDYAYTLAKRLPLIPQLGTVASTLSMYKEIGW